MMARPNLPEGVEEVEEVLRDGLPPLWFQPTWAVRFPWLIQGITGSRGSDGDFALFGGARDPGGPARWVGLAQRLGFPGVVHSRQVHGAAVGVVATPPRGLVLAPDRDGHLASSRGTLLAVTVADCVPVYLTDPVRRVIGLLHAGWRGVAAGILEAAFRRLHAEWGSLPRQLVIHLGPAICGACYEVGPDVHAALGLEVPSAPLPLDLRAVLVNRALALGVPPAHITVSRWCSRCRPPGAFFSYRRGDSGRQVAFLGLPREEVGLCTWCSWAREVRNRRGSRFFLCTLSRHDSAFPRYPPLPVTRCAGFTTRGGTGDGQSGAD